MNDVAFEIIGISTAFKPTLRQRMFAVVAITFGTVRAGLVGHVREVRGIGIPVAHLSVGSRVGLFVGIIQAVVPDFRVTFGDDGAQSRFQCLAPFAVGIFIISSRVVWSLCPRERHRRQQTACHIPFFHCHFLSVIIRFYECFDKVKSAKVQKNGE